MSGKSVAILTVATVLVIVGIMFVVFTFPDIFTGSELKEPTYVTPPDVTNTVSQEKTIATTTTTTSVTTTTVTRSPLRGIEVDIVSIVRQVVDGDTFDGFPSGRVRLADVDTPERGQEGYAQAKEALTDLILDKEVYLDVDDVGVMDQYNRLVCVVYIKHNSTHVLNVNSWLITNDYAKLSDYPNEFNPYRWILFIAVE